MRSRSLDGGSLVCESVRPAEHGLLLPMFGLRRVLHLVSTAVFLQLPRVGEPESAALAGVQLHAGVDLHVRLQLVRLTELPVADSALVGLLPGVDQQVSVVVLRRPELLPALLTLVRFDAGVQHLVALQLRQEQETLLADAADVRAVAAVLPDVVQVEVALVEGPAAGVAGELLVLVLRVALLVLPQTGAAAEALQADLTVERSRSRLLVPRPRRPDPRARLSLHPAATLAVVDQLLVLLQLTVVEKRLPAEVAHEGFLHAVNQHVSLQSPRPRKALPAFITPETKEKKQKGLND